jgi:hypothetical protein
MRQRIYFDGCSFTFGQSLELYCNPINTFTHDRMSKYAFNGNDFNFIRNNRWSNLVSIKMNSIEHNYSINGNANGKILYDLKNYLKFKKIEDFDYFVIQLSYFERFFSSGNFQWFPHPISMKSLIDEGVITFEEQEYTISNIEQIQLNYYLELVDIFQQYPQKLKILFWSNEWKNVLSVKEMSKFGLAFDGEYIVDDWASNNNLHICNDDKFLGSIIVENDTHLSIEGHKILANKIIKQL